MNERIKELIEKATIRGEEYLPGNDGHPTPTFYFDKEKFAELIVRECMDNLAWHGEDEAVSKMEWFKVNKLGIK